MKNQDELEALDRSMARQAELELLKPISFAELTVMFDKWMLLPDRGILKFLCAVYATNPLPRKAVWVMLIAPSGGGKTELLNSLVDLSDVHEISMLTTNTFLSGMPGKGDASLLPKLSGKIMLMKEWTIILSMNKDARAELMSQFRGIWDGRLSKSFGTGRERVWEGKVGLIAASTQAVDLNQQMYAHLGERFLNYRIIMPDRKEVARRSLKNDASQEKMVHELRDAMYSFLKGVNYDSEAIPELPEDVQEQLVNLANFCSYARSGVIRDMGFKKEVIFVPAAEMPTRMTQQLNTIGTGLAMVNGGTWETADMDILYKVALDSIPQTNKMVINEMARADGQSTSEIATALGYPTDPIRMYLENLAMLGVCTREKASGRPDRWTLFPEFGDLIRHYEHIEELTDEEIAKRKASEQSVEAVDEEFVKFPTL